MTIQKDKNHPKNTNSFTLMAQKSKRSNSVFAINTTLTQKNPDFNSAAKERAKVKKRLKDKAAEEETRLQYHKTDF
jgi:hypothetical protein